MSGCRNYGPFLGTLNSRCRIIIGIQKRDHNFGQSPLSFMFKVCFGLFRGTGQAGKLQQARLHSKLWFIWLFLKLGPTGSQEIQDNVLLLGSERTLKKNAYTPQKCTRQDVSVYNRDPCKFGHIDGNQRVVLEGSREPSMTNRV